MGTPSSVKGKASETVPNYYAARKKKEVIGSQMDFMLIKTLQDFNDPKSTQETKQCEETEDSLFLKSLIPTLSKLAPKNNKMAKMKIQELLFDLEFGEGT